MYRIQTVYQAVIPVFTFGFGSTTQGFYWKEETARRVITNDGGVRQGMVVPCEVLIMDNDDVLLVERSEDQSNRITKIEVHGDSDEELRAATLARLPEAGKEFLGLEFNAEKKAAQGLYESNESVREQMLVLDISEEEARVLGILSERKEALACLHEGLRKIQRNRL